MQMDSYFKTGNSSRWRNSYFAGHFFGECWFRRLPGERLVPWGPCPSCFQIQSVSSFTQSCPTLCDPMDCSMPGLPVHHQFLKFTQTHVHWVSDAIQPSHPLLSPSQIIAFYSERPQLLHAGIQGSQYTPIHCSFRLSSGGGCLTCP